MKWEPIETAPKDGTRVVICDGQTIAIAAFCDWDNGWCENEYDNLWHEPTHWMPLPDLPGGNERGPKP